MERRKKLYTLSLIFEETYTENEPSNPTVFIVSVYSVKINLK